MKTDEHKLYQLMSDMLDAAKQKDLEGVLSIHGQIGEFMDAQGLGPKFFKYNDCINACQSAFTLRNQEDFEDDFRNHIEAAEQYFSEIEKPE